MNIAKAKAFAASHGHRTEADEKAGTVTIYVGTYSAELGAGPDEAFVCRTWGEVRDALGY